MFNYITFNTASEILCFLTAVICLSGNKNNVWRLFIPYLFVTVFAEITGIYLRNQNQNNQWPYNILLVFQILFPGLIFKQLLKDYIKSNVIIISGTALLMLLFIYETAKHGFLRFNNTTYSVMCMLYVLYSLYYFYLLLNADDHVVLKYSAKFWWAAGTLLFCFGSTVVNVFRGLLSGLIIGDHNLTYYIYSMLNMILYSCWSYSFICRKWLTTTSGV